MSLDMEEDPARGLGFREDIGRWMQGPMNFFFLGVILTPGLGVPASI